MTGQSNIHNTIMLFLTLIEGLVQWQEDPLHPPIGGLNLPPHQGDLPVPLLLLWGEHHRDLLPLDHPWPPCLDISMKSQPLQEGGSLPEVVVSHHLQAREEDVQLRCTGDGDISMKNWGEEGRRHPLGLALNIGHSDPMPARRLQFVRPVSTDESERKKGDSKMQNFIERKVGNKAIDFSHILWLSIVALFGVKWLHARRDDVIGILTGRKELWRTMDEDHWSKRHWCEWKRERSCVRERRARVREKRYKPPYERSERCQKIFRGKNIPNCKLE